MLYIYMYSVRHNYIVFYCHYFIVYMKGKSVPLQARGAQKIP